MYLLHRIGPRLNSNFNSLSEILASDGPLSFDGVYSEVYEHYRALKGRDVTFFVTGLYVGGDNAFDIDQPPGRFCTWEQILEMAKYLGARIGYHGWEHRRCVGLSHHELMKELNPPHLFCRDVLAWPHGVFDDIAINVARHLGYKEAYAAGPYGNGSQFQKRRNYLGW